MKIVTVLGARPQFVKAAAVSRAIAAHNAAQPDSTTVLQEVIVHTGQHFDENMSDIFFREMEIPPPHYHLAINSVGHGAMTGRMLEKIEEILLEEKPDFVLVYGDTNSTLAGALAAKKLHIKVVHVEAGLRSFNMKMPEEINRILTDRISDILCCPTDTAVQNLIREGFEVPAGGKSSSKGALVLKTGDVMQDAALYYSTISSGMAVVSQQLGLVSGQFVLCTVHRAENTDDPHRLMEIVEALNEISLQMRVVLPLHPRTRKILTQCGARLNFDAIDPVGYFDMIELLKGARIVITDSGGLQKEAYFFGKPCVTLRDETEWVELVQQGDNVLAGARCTVILAAFSAMKDKMVNAKGGLYGHGAASRDIVRALAAAV
ncbi:non-hydrolyzing UDP-N-acetylglucosamine 2-epimerase [Geomonas anaerohicana]|uniref:UDP-N-acetylglucosamine 2-epimerase (Non-hydrolyzing) n=1 Tax=Geomonas anaerohicana TaxID=2798583 RepID=A0ABS0YCP7_9BACT|nr:UDP-N-acetylglucosamine 2-epimerase (non-hydrolyzing) [Geomonas anaerohicana]MBJ6749689.1 UDP-N-acetylglucosamine 2-epimerase (non-hydrolyzing) [Geomonas anaerohicana]